MVKYHGKALCRGINGLILWEFPSGETGFITQSDAIYLTELNLGLTAPDLTRQVNVLQY